MEDRLDPIRELAVDGRVSSVALVPGGELALVVDDHHVCVWHMDRDEPVLVLPRAARTSVGAIFARRDGAAILLYEPTAGDVDAYELPSGRSCFRGSTETFLIESAVALAGGANIALSGYYRGEGKSSLAVIPTRELGEEPDVLFTRFRKKRPISDYAYKLGAGPAGLDALVVFRDPQGDEERDEDDDDADDAVPDPVAYADVRGLHGFYVRGLDGAVRARLAWSGPVGRLSRLAAAPPWIAAECGDQVALVSLDGAQGSMIDARWLAASPDGSQVLVQQRDLRLAMIQVAQP